MWSVKNFCDSRSLLLLFLLLTLSRLPSPCSCRAAGSGLEWYTDDSVIIEPLHDEYEDGLPAAAPEARPGSSHDGLRPSGAGATRQLSHYPIMWPPRHVPPTQHEHAKSKSRHMANRQPMPPPPPQRFPSQTAVGGGSGGNIFGSCLTLRGEVGFCATLRQCFPALYTYTSTGTGDGHRDSTLPSSMSIKATIHNPELADVLRSISGSCKTPTTESEFYFKTDAELLRQNVICCATQDSSQPSVVSVSRPQETTTTTTMQLQSQPASVLKYPNRPKIPIGFGGHRPPGAVLRPLPVTVAPTPAFVSMPKPSPAPVPDGKETATEEYLVESSCGVPKIVGGNETHQGKFPWMVAILNGQKQICGGSLIDNKYVLTAAHCVAHMRPHDLARVRILLGAHNVIKVNQGAVVKKIVKLMRHRGFSHKTLHNDIALLKLDSPVQFSTRISPICLDRPEHQRYENSQAIIAGWGSVSEFGAQPPTLHEVTIDIWTNARCKAKYGHLAPGGIMDHMMCAGSPDRDACRGDSGGPLMSFDGAKYTQIGLVSWGIGCGRFPGVYSRVAHFRDWIDKQREL